VRLDTHTPFHIDLAWWSSRGRNLRRFLAEILNEADPQPSSEPTDYIDPDTAEVISIDELWGRVLTEKAYRPDYITSATPLTNAVLRALVENLNRPMNPVELHRRINRTSPEAIVKVLRTARVTYGIVPVDESEAAKPSSRGRKKEPAAAS
jgi:hypothetical protein